MILAMLLWGCQCGTRSPADLSPTPPMTTFDRAGVRGSSCYRADDGTVLELMLSASTSASGVLTRPGTEPQPLKGRRTGRTLDFGAVEVELLGRTVALVDGPNRMLLQSTGCQK